MTNYGLVTIMAGSALFYGTSQPSWQQELEVVIFLSILSSLLPMAIGHVISLSNPGDFDKEKELVSARRQWEIRQSLTCGLGCRQKKVEEIEEIITQFTARKKFRTPTGFNIGLELETILQDASGNFYLNKPPQGFCRLISVKHFL